MKKIFAIILLMNFSFSSYAGEPVNNNRSFFNAGDGEKCYDESSHVINLGVGFGSRTYHSIYRGAGYSYGRTPAFSLTYEQPWPKKLGPGYLGVGAYLGFQHEYYDYDYSYAFSNSYFYHHKWNYYMVAARATYHWDVLNSKNAEVYAGIIVGVRFQTENYETNDPNKNNDPYNYTSSFAYPAYSVFAGARWYFAKSIGVFAEAGYGISYGTVGLSIKF